MRQAEPKISTAADAHISVMNARFETPENSRLVRSLAAFTRGVALAAYSYGAITLSDRMPIQLSSGERMVVIAMGIAVAFGLALVTSKHLADIRFGLRPILDRQLHVSVCRDFVSCLGVQYARDRKIAFTSEPHRWARREDRAERVSGETIPETYRLAYEVKLQHGENFTVLAVLSDEQGANAIARRLQVLDEIATRGAASKGHAFGQRQSPE